MYKYLTDPGIFLPGSLFSKKICVEIRKYTFSWITLSKYKEIKFDRFTSKVGRYFVCLRQY